MTTLRRTLKRWFYGRCPGVRGTFPYFGERIHFPPRSLLFDLACAQGIFEEANLRILQAAVRENTWYFDVGANIGLMSAPLLQSKAGVTVVSVEASPATSACLRATVAASPRRSRWHVVAKALGAREGQVDFYASAPSHGVFDGLRDTGRGRGVQPVTVEMTRLDTLWDAFGKPAVSCIKIDVEGAELDVLRGARACLQASRPAVLLEWTTANLGPYGVAPESLWETARDLGYQLFAAPAVAKIENPAHLHIQMGLGETFLLLPAP